MLGQWLIGGKSADKRDLVEALALARQHRKRLCDLDRERRKLEGDARAVGAAIRRSVRAQERRTFPLRCKLAALSGKRKGTLRSRKFETLAGLTHSRPSYVAGDGFSSFHCKITSRGLGGRRLARGRPYTRGEAVRAVRYILREAAREIAGGGMVSNISLDPDEIAGVFAALEELEVTAGAKDANVYLSIVVSLPHELESEREALLREICEPFDEEGLPYAAVLHAPDPDGDQRNYHAHIMVSLRPFRREDDGSFAFATGTAADLNDAAFIAPFRARVAERMNAAMERAGHKRRFTARSRKERGLEPVDPRNAKSTPGRKHHERRTDNVAHGLTERDWLAEHGSARLQLTNVLRDVLVRAPDQRRERIAQFEAAEERLVAASERAQPLPALVVPSPVVTPRPVESVTADRTEAASTPAPVAHAQHSPPPAKLSEDPPAPVEVKPPRAESPAAQEQAIAADMAMGKPSENAAIGSPKVAKPNPTEAKRIAREAALARQATVSPAAGGARISSAKTPEKSSGASETQPMQAKPATGGMSPPPPPPDREPRPVRDTVRAFRESAVFRELSLAEQSALNDALQMPMRYIVDDLVRLRIEDGVIRVGCTSDAVLASLCSLATTPAGWRLLADVAEAKRHEANSDWGWLEIAPPGEMSPTAAQAYLKGGRGEGR